MTKQKSFGQLVMEGSEGRQGFWQAAASSLGEAGELV